MIKEDIILIGGGGHCRSCIDVIVEEGKFQIAGIVDVKDMVGHKILDFPVIACDEDLPELCMKYKNFFITIGQIGSAEKRIRLYNELKNLGASFPIIKSPFAHISRYSKIGEGSIVMHHAIVNSSAIVGVNCILNSNALVEHDAVIGDHCHISTGAIVNGTASVGHGSFVGSGAVVVNNTRIPENSFIKANSIFK